MKKWIIGMLTFISIGGGKPLPIFCQEKTPGCAGGSERITPVEKAKAYLLR